MTLSEVKNVLQTNLLTVDVDLSRDIFSVAATESRSDVLPFRTPKTLLTTGVINQPTIGTIEKADDIRIDVQEKQPDQIMTDETNQEQIPFISQPARLFLSNHL